MASTNVVHKEMVPVEKLESFYNVMKETHTNLERQLSLLVELHPSARPFSHIVPITFKPEEIRDVVANTIGTVAKFGTTLSAAQAELLSADPQKKSERVWEFMNAFDNRTFRENMLYFKYALDTLRYNGEFVESNSSISYNIITTTGKYVSNAIGSACIDYTNLLFEGSLVSEFGKVHISISRRESLADAHRA